MKSHVGTVQKWFGIENRVEPVEIVGDPPALQPAKIALVIGPSGSGKTQLLRSMRKSFVGRWIDLDEIRLPDRAVVDCFGRAKVERILEMLSRMGLGEAWTYLRTPWQLSEGERWRVRLAIAMMKRPDVIAADEFCAVLDRVTACVVARNVRKAIDAMGSIALVAVTSHDDLEKALRPDRIVRCDFQGRWRVDQ